MQQQAAAAVKSTFAEVFGPGGKVHVIRAPGRVNLIGEHTDYNDGFVFPMAIEPHVLLACRSRDDGEVRIASTHFPGQVVRFSVESKIAPGEPAWANYSRGVAAERAHRERQCSDTGSAGGKATSCRAKH